MFQIATKLFFIEKNKYIIMKIVNMATSEKKKKN